MEAHNQNVTSRREFQTNTGFTSPCVAAALTSPCCGHHVVPIRHNLVCGRCKRVVEACGE